MTRRQTEPMRATRSRRLRTVRARAGNELGLTSYGFHCFHMIGDLAIEGSDPSLRMTTLIYARPNWQR